jgi:hypothetical protein
LQGTLDFFYRRLNAWIRAQGFWYGKDCGDGVNGNRIIPIQLVP